MALAASLDHRQRSRLVLLARDAARPCGTLGRQRLAVQPLIKRLIQPLLAVAAAIVCAENVRGMPPRLSRRLTRRRCLVPRLPLAVHPPPRVRGCRGPLGSVL